MINKVYYLTTHAQKRMHERDISQKELKIVLDDPQINYQGMHGQLNLIREVIPGRKIRVVTKEEENYTVIITVMVLKN